MRSNFFNFVVMIEIILAALLSYCLMGAVFARCALGFDGRNVGARTGRVSTLRALGRREAVQGWRGVTWRACCSSAAHAFCLVGRHCSCH